MTDVRFKFRLSRNEMELVGSATKAYGMNEGPVRSLDDLIRMEQAGRIWRRLYNMYRPDRDRYTVCLSAMEAKILEHILEYVMCTGAFGEAVALRLADELRRQKDRAVNVYNAL